MFHVLHLALFATDPLDAGCVLEAEQIVGRMDALASTVPDTLRAAVALATAAPVGCTTWLASPTLQFQAGEPASFAMGGQVPVEAGYGRLDGELRQAVTFVTRSVEVDASTSNGVLTLGVSVDGGGISPAGSSQPWFGPGLDVDWTADVEGAHGPLVFAPAPHLILVAELVEVQVDPADVRAAGWDDGMRELAPEYAGLSPKARQRAAERILGLR